MSANCWKQLKEGPLAGKWYPAEVSSGALDALVKKGKARHYDNKPAARDTVAPDAYAHDKDESDPQVVEEKPKRGPGRPPKEPEQ